jgi:hypothetical protein
MGKYEQVPLEEGQRISKKQKAAKSTFKGVDRKVSLRIFFSGLSIAFASLLWYDKFRNNSFISTALRNSISTSLDEAWESPLCGGTPEEARSNGCIFDIMHYAWVPELCYDPMLSEAEFAPFQNNSWYSDLEATNEIPEDLILKGEVESAYNTLEYREYQCAYGWKMLRNSLMTRTPVDSRTADLEESATCANLIFTELNTSDKPTSTQIVHFTLGYLTCERLSSTRLLAKEYQG